MKVVIVEDEILSSEYLEKLLIKTPFSIEIVGRVDSVKKGIQWFSQNPNPDLIFMDIDLGDGLCFEIFDLVEINCPIVFTTAFDSYAIQAFKVNSIDYLLKPVDMQELKQALHKFTQWGTKQPDQQKVQHVGNLLTDGYKKRFIVKIGDLIKTISVKDVLFCFSSDKATYVATRKGRNYLIDYSLDRLELLLNPEEYFRVNRKYIIGYEAIVDIVSYSNSRLKINLIGGDGTVIIVARDRVSDFKNWLDR